MCLFKSILISMFFIFLFHRFWEYVASLEWYCKQQGGKFEQFLHFFRSYTSDHRVRLWPKCFAQTCPNTNMALEAFHSDFKRNYLMSRMNIRMDSLLSHLLDYLGSKLRSRIETVTTDGKSYREVPILEAHRRAANIPKDSIHREVAGVWLVPSRSQEGVTYKVALGGPCPQPLCLRCRECDLCVHMVTCTCPRHERDELCSHVHACGSHFQEDVRMRFSKRNRKSAFTELEYLDAFVKADEQKLAPQFVTVPSVPTELSTPRRPANMLIRPQRRLFTVKRRKLSDAAVE